MQFTGEQFWDFGSETLGIGWSKRSEQAAVRSAVSRAYYAAFHCARRVAESYGATIGDAKTAHQLVIDWFDSHSDVAFNDIADKLRDLRKQRNSADYDTASGWTESDARTELETAKRVLAKLKQLAPLTP